MFGFKNKKLEKALQGYEYYMQTFPIEYKLMLSSIGFVTIPDTQKLFALGILNSEQLLQHGTISYYDICQAVNTAYEMQDVPALSDGKPYFYEDIPDESELFEVNRLFSFTVVMSGLIVKKVLKLSDQDAISFQMAHLNRLIDIFKNSIRKTDHGQLYENCEAMVISRSFNTSLHDILSKYADKLNFTSDED